MYKTILVIEKSVDEICIDDLVCYTNKAIIHGQFN